MDDVKQESDFGTPETQSKGGGVTKGYTADNEKIAHINHQNHFDWLYYHHKIDDQQWMAGEYLRRDAYVSGQFSYIKSSADFSVKGNITDSPAQFIIDAKKRYGLAFKELSFDEAFIVNVVVIDDGYITGSWRRVKKGMVHLRTGLDSLIDFYGLFNANK